MKILIDFTQIPVKKAGMGVYALNLISSIYEIDKQNTYFILIQNDDVSLEFISDLRFKFIRVSSKYFRNRYLRLLLEQLYIPFLVIKHKIDTVHSFHYSFPIFLTAKRIITIPDMTLFKFPEHHIKVYVYYFRFFTWLASILANRIITISYSSKADIISELKINKEKIIVTYLSHDLPDKSSITKAESDNVKNKFQIKNEYMLYIGTIEPRKNLERLISAFEKFEKENNDIQLIIVGQLGWHFNNLLKLIETFKNQVILTGYLDRKEKAILLAGAKIFVYPSIYEGFGIPVLEALWYGIPTITSNTSSLIEITNSAALLIDPLSIDDIHNAMKRVMHDNFLYDNLKQKSIEQAKKFSWRKTAEETINLYNSIYEN